MRKKKATFRRAKPGAGTQTVPARKAVARKAKPAQKGGIAAKPEPTRRPAASGVARSRRRGLRDKTLRPPYEFRGMALESGGPSGDTEALSRAGDADSESVEELVEDGRAFETGIGGGVEEAAIADRGGIRAREVPADGVPADSLDED